METKGFFVFFLNISSWSLRKHIVLLIVMIFLPVVAMLLITGYKQYKQALQEFDNDTNRLIDLFIEEQINISSQAHQLLTVLSHVPAVINFDISQCNDLLKKIHKE